MNKSRARLAADWFAKLRQNAVTQEVEHTDVVDAETEALEAKADAAAVGIIVGPIGPIGPIGPQGPTGAAGATGPAGSTSYNAGTLGGYSANTNRNIANTIPVRDGSGYLQLGWINTTSGLTTAASSDYYVNTNDGYIRKKTLANVRSEIVGGSAVNTVGSYAWLGGSTTSIRPNPGNTFAGSTLRYAGTASTTTYSDNTAARIGRSSPTTPSGTWRAMGGTGSVARYNTTLFLRIS